MLAFASVTAAADPLQEGLSAYSAKRYGEAVRILAPLARAGNAVAQIHLGLLYYHGKGVPENDRTAFRWFSRAADQEMPDGMYHLANMYAFGLGLPEAETDPDLRAAQWYFRAARRGHADAQYSLGILFLAGKGVEKNTAEALRWIRRAADLGHAAARQFLGAMDPGPDPTR